MDKDDENELGVLEFIHCLVETLDKVWLVHASDKKIVLLLQTDQQKQRSSEKIRVHVISICFSAFPSCESTGSLLHHMYKLSTNCSNQNSQLTAI